MEKLVSWSYHQCFLTSYPELRGGGGGLLQVTCTSAHTESGQVHAALRGVSGIPPPRPPPWPRPLPICHGEWAVCLTALSHSISSQAALRPCHPLYRCHFFNPLDPPPPFFFHSREVWPIMLSHIPLFNSLHATLPQLWHPTLPPCTTHHTTRTHKHTHAYLPAHGAQLPVWQAREICLASSI